MSTLTTYLIISVTFYRWEYCTRKIMDATGTIALGLAVAYEYQLRYFNDSKLENVSHSNTDKNTTIKKKYNFRLSL